MTELSDKIDYLIRCVDWDVKQNNLSRYPISLVKYILLDIREDLSKMEELND